MEPQVEQQAPPPDPFDAAVVATSTYVEPKTPEPPPVEEKPAAPPVEEKPAPPVAAKPWDGRRPTNAEARKDPNARIAQQTWDQRESERRADAAERRAADLERELQAARQPKQPEKPQPQAQPVGDEFPDYAKYLESHPDASLEQWMNAWYKHNREIERKQEREEAEEARVLQATQTRVDAFGERYAQALQADPALEQRIDRRLLTALPLTSMTKKEAEVIKNIPDPRARHEAMVLCHLADQWIDSEHAAAILEYASDPKTFQRLATLHPDALVRDIAKFEAGLGAASRKDSGPAPRPSASQANPPIKPLGTTPQRASDDDGSDDEPVDAYIRRENARDRKAGRL